MNKLVSVSSAGVHRVFKEHGHYSEKEICNILTSLVTVWRAMEDIPKVTRDFVFSGLNVDELVAQTLWNAVGIELVNVGQLVRKHCTDGIFISWSVTPFTIMLEFSDDNN